MDGHINASLLHRSHECEMSWLNLSNNWVQTMLLQWHGFGQEAHQSNLEFHRLYDYVFKHLLMQWMVLLTSISGVFSQGQKDNVLSYVGPETLNTIMGVMNVLKCPNKVHWRVQRELAVILTCWVNVSQLGLAIQNCAIKVLAHEFVIHKSP